LDLPQNQKQLVQKSTPNSVTGPVRNPSLGPKSSKNRNLSHSELVKKAAKANSVLNKMSKNRPLPVPYIGMKKKKVVKQETYIPDDKMLGEEILMRRRGDSFGIFSIIEKCKKKYFYWDETNRPGLINPNTSIIPDLQMHNFKKQKTASSSENQELRYINKLIGRWIAGLEWYKKINKFMKEKGMKESIELFE
jgi:hypothetical protein